MTLRRATVIVLSLIVAAVIVVVGARTMLRSADGPASPMQGTIERVVDGDTLDVVVDAASVRVRLLNIDAPEHDAATGDAECLGREATAALTRMLPPGTSVTLALDAEQHDRYDRLLAGVFVGDTLINAEMARRGLAASLVIGANDRFYGDVRDAEQHAIESRLGIHGPACTAAAPAQVGPARSG